MLTSEHGQSADKGLGKLNESYPSDLLEKQSIVVCTSLLSLQCMEVVTS